MRMSNECELPDLNKIVGSTDCVQCFHLVAVTMYEGMGYTVFRRVRDYYSGGVQPAEDAYGESIFAKDICPLCLKLMPARSGKTCGNLVPVIRNVRTTEQTEGISL